MGKKRAEFVVEIVFDDEEFPLAALDDAGNSLVRWADSLEGRRGVVSWEVLRPREVVNVPEEGADVVLDEGMCITLERLKVEEGPLSVTRVYRRDVDTLRRLVEAGYVSTGEAEEAEDVQMFATPAGLQALERYRR